MTRLYLRPLGLLPAGGPSTEAAPLAGGRFSFSLVELILRDPSDGVRRSVMPLGELRRWAATQPPEIAERAHSLLAALARPRPALAGLTLDRPRLMAVLNITPDSFSDGGDFFNHERALTHGLALHRAGADIVDVGGESTRPGAAPVSVEDEIDRVVPVVRRLAERGARVSIDTRHATVMRASLEAGAAIINDISGLADPDSLRLAAESKAPVVLMHMQGEPGTMQQAPRYDHAALDVYDWLEARLNTCLAAGIPLERIVVDPGIGFGKSLEHNLDILRHLSLYHTLGAPVLLGVSRKRFIAALSQDEPPKDRLPGTLAASLEGLNQGCQILRIHDLAAFTQARAVWEGMNR